MELGYGPITVPSVKATRAAFYLCLFQVAPLKELLQGPREVSQDFGLTRCTQTHTRMKDLSTIASKLAHQCEAVLTDL